MENERKLGVRRGHHGLADASELVHSGVGAQHGVVADRHVAGEAREAGDDDVGTYLTIVGDVRSVHDETSVADPRAPPAFRRAHVDGHMLANHVVRADFETCRAAAEPRDLGLATDARIGRDPRALADAGAAYQCDVRADLDTGTQLYIGSHDREGPDPGILSDPRLRIDESRRMNRHRHFSPFC
jgi:hypothetical protein